MCANTSGENNYLLPIVRLPIQWSKEKMLVNCLVDTGRQYSYFSNKVIKWLKCLDKVLIKGNYQVKTYLGVAERQFSQVTFDIEIEKGR